jgi:hypothetical protein
MVVPRATVAVGKAVATVPPSVKYLSSACVVEYATLALATKDTLMVV